MLRLRLSDGGSYAQELEATDPASLRVGIATAWAKVPDRPQLRVLQLHVHTLDPALDDEWYWVDHRLDRIPQMLGGAVLSRGWITPDEAGLLWKAAVRTERLVSEHGRSIRGLAAWAFDETGHS